jgi:hypothetical protein
MNSHGSGKFTLGSIDGRGSEGRRQWGGWWRVTNLRAPPQAPRAMRSGMNPSVKKKYPDWRDAGREGTGVSRVEGKSITLIQLHES